MKYTITSPQQMIELGQSLTIIGSKFLVHGELGAGKTHLCKGFAQALHCDPQHVKSPTYVYFHEYDHVLFHGDFYRVEDPSILTLRGILDVIQDYDYCFIEWPRFAEYYADTSRYTITITHDEGDPNTRQVTISTYQP